MLDTHRDLQEIGRLGAEILAQLVTPQIRAEDKGKFVAIDVLTREFELDADDCAAIERLRQRCPTAEIWLGRVGERAAHKMRRA